MLQQELDKLGKKWVGKWVRFQLSQYYEVGGDLVIAEVRYVIEHETFGYKVRLVTDRGTISPEDVLESR